MDDSSRNNTLVVTGGSPTQRGTVGGLPVG